MSYECNFFQCQEQSLVLFSKINPNIPERKMILHFSSAAIPFILDLNLSNKAFAFFHLFQGGNTRSYTTKIFLNSTKEVKRVHYFWQSHSLKIEEDKSESNIFEYSTQAQNHVMSDIVHRQSKKIMNHRIFWQIFEVSILVVNVVVA